MLDNPSRIEDAHQNLGERGRCRCARDGGNAEMFAARHCDDGARAKARPQRLIYLNVGAASSL
jgi:hypothetical protein